MHPSHSRPSSRSSSFPAMVLPLLWLLAAGPWSVPLPAVAQEDGPLPSIEEKTEGMERMDGMLPLYWDADLGRLWMEIPALDTEMIHYVGYGAGLGSNDLGLDRGALRGSRIVEFERVGRKVLMIQPNYRFRASTDNPAEERAVRDAFARSILWGFTAAAETDGRVLVDLSDFLLRDPIGAGNRMRPGSYRLDESRSTIWMEFTDAFPENTELEVQLTFVRQDGGGGGFGGGGGALEGVGDVASTGEAATIRIHHSFVQLPDEGFEPRAFDPRAGFGSVSWQDYSVDLGVDMTQRYIRRHRLEKQNPAAERSPPVEPIVYYLDPGTPEPVRSALLDGARWWNEAFEAAGYVDAFQVRMRPDSISPLDARYNVINWVHRSTRGWSTGGSVSDPRTGEIIKGVVTLGSLRIRQDYMIAEGLLSPYTVGDEDPPELAEWAVARIRQLSAHEVGHTIGLGHNYYNSQVGRISVMDYPHPLVSLNADGTLDHSDVYDDGIGEWDRVAIRYGYSDLPEGTDEAETLAGILDEAWAEDIRYMTNQDVATSPQADQWANGTDVAAELNRMMDVRAAAMERFGVQAIRSGRPMSTIEDVLVPLYMHHRYQVESTASAVGGLQYTYAMRGGGLTPLWRVPADQQIRALDALMRTLRPSELTVPAEVVEAIPPRPPGWRGTRELFPRYTGSAFDAVTPAVVAASHTVSSLLTPERGARMVEQAIFDPSLPSLEDVLTRLVDATFGASTAGAYEGEVKRAVEAVVVDGIKRLADDADMPQVRAAATATLRDLHAALVVEVDQPHAILLASDIERFLQRPMEPMTLPGFPSPPPGAPIGEPATEWLGAPGVGQPARAWLDRTEARCAWEMHG
ncbi:MAG: zinc-dependent metalloprotease [Longimicrobiales bacterium]|nr:zinc-dependent metalloprotease [Longimicrobiales bacterium]